MLSIVLGALLGMFGAVLLFNLVIRAPEWHDREES
jgi:hypothetical protein